jgi:peptidoglycan/LPS O-acetylase OafA/YrhL
MLSKTRPVTTRTVDRLLYIRGFDGLRALAALAVIGFHLHLRGMSLGFVGVQFFFVLSGFLITGILLSKKDQPGYFRNFYARRSIRIFPIYYLTLIAVIGIALASGWNVRDWPFYALYLQNWLLSETQFGPAFPIHLAHTWSLACEEQFYLLWPAVVHITRPRTLAVTCVALIILVPASRVIGIAEGNPFAVLYPLPAVVDCLAWGALTALALQSGKRLMGIALYVLPLLAIAAAMIVFHIGVANFWTQQGFALSISGGVVFLSLLGPLGAALLVIVYFDTAWISRALEWRPLRYLGRISYGLYLYHWPILLVVRHLLRLTRTQEIGVVVIVTILVAMASFELIERPLLRLTHRH